MNGFMKLLGLVALVLLATLGLAQGGPWWVYPQYWSLRVVFSSMGGLLMFLIRNLCSGYVKSSLLLICNGAEIQLNRTLLLCALLLCAARMYIWDIRVVDVLVQKLLWCIIILVEFASSSPTSSSRRRQQPCPWPTATIHCIQSQMQLVRLSDERSLCNMAVVTSLA